MRIFVTGATGFIGRAVVPELLAAGHQVVGLARSDASAQALAAAGAEAVRGDLHDLDVLRSAAAAADGVIHLAFIHDFANFAAAAATDGAAVEALGQALAGSGKPLVIAGGLLGLKPGHVSVEADRAVDSPRGAADDAIDRAAAAGVRAQVVRLPPSVHDAGDQGFVPMLIAAARAQGVAPYLGDGANRWPAVHRRDAARLFRLALERGEAGARWHAVGDAGIPAREIAAAIGRALAVDAAPVDPTSLGFLGWAFSMDAPSDATVTREQLGWEPTGPGLLDELAPDGPYFVG